MQQMKEKKDSSQRNKRCSRKVNKKLIENYKEKRKGKVKENTIGKVNFIGALGILEPVIPGEPLIKRSGDRRLVSTING